jgi:hypothetical protein
VFKGTLAEVYLIDVQTGVARRIRDVELIGTPLAALQRIVAFGRDRETDQGYCFAESGSSRSAASPRRSSSPSSSCSRAAPPATTTRCCRRRSPTTARAAARAACGPAASAANRGLTTGEGRPAGRARQRKTGVLASGSRRPFYASPDGAPRAFAAAKKVQAPGGVGTLGPWIRPPITSFAEVMGWLRGEVAADPGFGRVELLSRGQRRGPGRPRSSASARAWGSSRPGGRPPEFDVLVLGAADGLAAALARLPVAPRPRPPAARPAGLLQRAVEEAVKAAQNVLQGRVADQLIDVGLALNRERDPRRVLELILRHARAITNADAGSVYVVEDEGKRLRFRVAHNDSVPPTSPSSRCPSPTPRSSAPASAPARSSTSPTCAPPETALSHDRSFDERFGYETRSMLTVPMRAPEGPSSAPSS